jgi:uncharacterized protein (DUF433 family)
MVQLEASMQLTELDWSLCDDVEIIPGKVSGQPTVKGTRILAQGVVENAEDGYTPEELANEHFPGLGVERARRIIAFARRHARHPA